ncbi:argininosuccinate lyase [Candidatus Bathyarchaeota archaeon RBG_13_38_9]|nr:MAG: argininosuccinate lyase [Candidatus Bathyarchaeota archaeon RBG_13_38_9]
MTDEKIVDRERFGRARKASASEIVELESKRNSPIPFDVASYYGQLLVHRAHTIMLSEEGIIVHEEARQILQGLQNVEKKALSNPQLVGYMSTESALIEEVGPVGGKMHIGRSRNDLGHTQRRIFYRDQIERVIKEIIEFRVKLIDVAINNIETIMPGYTHWRQAQPTTFAHYLLAHSESASRTIDSLEGIYRRTNQSPLGSAAFAGTGWQINRIRTKELLGFDELLENSLDGVASIDYFMEFAAVIAIHMSNLSRLAEDLQIWSSDEYLLIDLDESYAGTSSIMPQKKNPLILEQIKAYAAESLGNMVATIASMKGTSYTNTVDRVMLEPIAIDTVVGSTRIMGGIVETLRPMKENMVKRLMEGFTTTTDLADTLVKKHGLPFRQAHDIIVDVTLSCLRDDKKASEISNEMIENASLKVLGRPLKISDTELREATDPYLNVQRRNVIGGPSVNSVKAMINNQRALLTSEKSRYDARIKRVSKALSKLKVAENIL